jgi:hypothetical protein
VVSTSTRGSDGTYGGPRITAELHDNGQPVNHTPVARVMRRFGLRGLDRAATGRAPTPIPARAKHRT